MHKYLKSKIFSLKISFCLGSTTFLTSIAKTIYNLFSRINLNLATIRSEPYTSNNLSLAYYAGIIGPTAVVLL